MWVVKIVVVVVVVVVVVIVVVVVVVVSSTTAIHSRSSGASVTLMPFSFPQFITHIFLLVRFFFLETRLHCQNH